MKLNLYTTPSKFLHKNVWRLERVSLYFIKNKVMSRGRPTKNIPPVVVVYKKTAKGKLYLKIFEGIHSDDLLNSRKRNPLLPSNYEMVAVGVGSSFIESFKKEYKIK